MNGQYSIIAAGGATVADGFASAEDALDEAKAIVMNKPNTPLFVIKRLLVVEARVSLNVSVARIGENQQPVSGPQPSVGVGERGGLAGVIPVPVASPLATILKFPHRDSANADHTTSNSSDKDIA